MLENISIIVMTIKVGDVRLYIVVETLVYQRIFANDSSAEKQSVYSTAVDS